MPGGFVGRAGELDSLRTSAAQALAGQPQLVFVEGVPGIGKTSMLAEFASTLQGWHTLAVSGYEDERRLPFGLLSRLVIPDRPEGWSLEQTAGQDGIDPFAVGAELVQLLGDIEQFGPVAVVVDDAPWADSQSLRALTFALRRLRTERVLVVLTMRSSDVSALPPGLLHYGQDHATHIRLAGLGTDEVRELFGRLGLGFLSPRAADRLREHTAGSPLHLRALFQELPVEELRQSRGALPAPSSFGSLVLAALAGCSEPTRRLLMASAVVGLECQLAQAASIGEVADPLQALEDATQTKLVDARRDGDGWVVAFRHPLIRSAVYDDLGPSTRSRLHARAAEAQHAKELSHRVAAAGEGPDQALVGALIAQADGEESLARLSAAADLRLTAARFAPTGRAQDSLVLDAVDLFLRAGETAEAVAFIERLSDMPDTAKRTLVLARLAAMQGRHDHVEALARSVWNDGNDIDRASAAAMLAQVAVLRSDNAGAASWARQASSTGTLPAPVADEILAIRAIGLAMSGQATAGLRILDESTAKGASAALLATSGVLRMITDDYAGARRDLQVSVPGHPGWTASPRVLSGLGALADVEYRAGAWDDSRRHAEQAVSLVTDTDQTWLLAFVHAIAVFVPAAQGNWRDAESHVAAATAAAAGLPDEASAAYAANAAVHLAACRGDAMAVVQAAEPLIMAPAGAPKEPGVMLWAGQYAAALVALGRYQDADVALGELAEVADRLQRRSALATVARVRGELAVARRRPAAARAAFSSAVTLGAGAATALDQARTQALYGGFLRRAGERQAAGEQLRAARDAFVRLGAMPFLDRCDAELLACGLAVDRPAGQVDSRLTRQERAVARLVCAGKSNREVAAELIISVKTVGYHLGNTYAKLGVNTRTQLAALLNRPDSTT
jgi:ATP/maltotriose-dependent transcriptional regulator MalT